MEKELEIIEIDNKEYYVMKEVVRGENIYFYLSNVNDFNDIMIRKATSKESDLVIPLESKEEFDIACALLFTNNEEK